VCSRNRNRNPSRSLIRASGRRPPGARRLPSDWHLWSTMLLRSYAVSQPASSSVRPPHSGLCAGPVAPAEGVGGARLPHTLRNAAQPTFRAGARRPKALQNLFRGRGLSGCQNEPTYFLTTQIYSSPGSRAARVIRMSTHRLHAATGLPATAFRRRTTIPTRSGLPRQIQPLAPRPRRVDPSFARHSRQTVGWLPRRTRTERYVTSEGLPASWAVQHRCTTV
jgi:hypothetical protein